jgi:hypothetical protein
MQHHSFQGKKVKTQNAIIIKILQQTHAIKTALHLPKINIDEPD